jgi:OOP family OmpA-OmpF porin
MNRRINSVDTRACAIQQYSLPLTPVTMEMLIDFDLNSADVKPQYHKKLAKVASFLRENHAITATIKGQAINLLATPSRAREISQHRAQNIVNYLVDIEDIQRSRLTAEGFSDVDCFIHQHSDHHHENFRMNIILDYKE